MCKLRHSEPGHEAEPSRNGLSRSSSLDADVLRVGVGGESDDDDDDDDIDRLFVYQGEARHEKPSPTLDKKAAQACADRSSDAGHHSAAAHAEERLPPRGVWLRLLPLYICVGFDVAVMMGMSPFLPQFTRERLSVPETRLGSAVGLIASIYHFANALSSSYFGHLSDLHGRRPVLLLGLSVSCVSTALFPLSPTLWVAVLNRFLAGLCNTNFTVTKAMLADVTRTWPPALRSQAFGYLGAVWGVSRFFSSGFSGLTVGVSLRFLPPFLADNEYVFPCFGIALMLALTVVMAYFCLPESNAELVGARAPAETATPAAAGVAKALHSRRMIDRARLLYLHGGSTLLRLLVVHMLQHFCNGGLLTIAVLAWQLDAARGGGGLSTHDIGILFAAFGLSGVLFQLSAFSWLSRRVGLRALYRSGLLCAAAGAALVVLGCAQAGALAADGGVARNFGLARVSVMSLYMAPTSVGFMLGLPLLITLMTNAAPPEVMGLAQGTAQSTGSVLRTASPLFMGTLFSASVNRSSAAGVWLPFVLISLLYVVMFAATAHLPPSVERAREAMIDDGADRETEVDVEDGKARG